MTDTIKNYYETLSEGLKTEFNRYSLFLCELDSLTGDGDHGSTIKRGMDNIKTFEVAQPKTVADIYKAIGLSMLKKMGGASGPIFSTVFIQFAIALNGTEKPEDITPSMLLQIFEETLHGITDLTGTKPGEKTMVDAVYGSIRSLKNGLEAEPEMSQDKAWALIADGAEQGAKDTKNQKATKGRAKFMGEKTIGKIDAGAVSFTLITRILENTWLTAVKGLPAATRTELKATFN